MCLFFIIKISIKSQQLQPSWMEDRAVEPTGNFESRPLKDHPNAIWFHLNK
jgi:hypothetical protein